MRTKIRSVEAQLPDKYKGEDPEWALNELVAEGWLQKALAV